MIPSAFQKRNRLKPHVAKHPGTVSPVPLYLPGRCPSPDSMKQESNEEEESETEPNSSTTNLSTSPTRSNAPATPVNEATFFNIISNWQNAAAAAAVASSQQPLGLNSSNPQMFNFANSIHSSEEISNTSPLSDSQFAIQNTLDLIDVEAKKRLIMDDISNDAAKRLKLNSIKMLRDEPIPMGYVRFRFNEDCGYSHCGYREHQTHFHCVRKDCGYSFCDKTRFVQHTARHERLDTLMGNDFKQYRMNVDCGQPKCVHNNATGSSASKANHFHCVKCDFVCCDTNKLVAHRRAHLKMENINAAGFEKYAPNQDCKVDSCNHNGKQTHYHCLQCNYAVLGLSSMPSHKDKHKK
ncbi:zinc finger protein castor 1-like protein [Dinothrombium tinctorium]|uniref:Zinc finger protein castor 1-like protein n=1 Tax=Dinothrombium tinctorium TaxID=1965070 RepID=A0A3S4RJJ8_9ACAR|nr:zinc finger protein castor 1-like protein [Dinothrombium tinctorium]RWS16989.1 zinc finger protein castor 1-like protein [Dinothrombium tinctorium]